MIEAEGDERLRRAFAVFGNYENNLVLTAFEDLPEGALGLLRGDVMAATGLSTTQAGRVLERLDRLGMIRVVWPPEDVRQGVAWTYGLNREEFVSLRSFWREFVLGTPDLRELEADAADDLRRDTVERRHDASGEAH